MTKTSGSNTLFIAILFFVLAEKVHAQTISPGDTAICPGTSVILTANPAGDSYQWRRNGVVLAGTNNRTYTATTAGTYDVIVTTANVPALYAAVVVTVNPKPVAGFTFVKPSVCTKDEVQFNNTSTGNGLSYQWNFGDPNSGLYNFSTDTNPKHLFIGANLGGAQSFIVTLVVTNTTGCRDTFRNNSNPVTFDQPSSKLNGTGFVSPNVFKNCPSTSTTFTFVNQSNTNNTKYEFFWGDALNTYNSFLPPFTSTQHTYTTGDYTMKFVVTGANGCVDTGVYRVFVGSTPSGGIPPPGGLTLCVGETVGFGVFNTASNTPGTTYAVTFSDDPLTVLHYNHPPPDTIYHTFAKTSCGSTAPNYNNSFYAVFVATNPCFSSSNTTEPIYVSNKPKAVIAVLPGDTVCVGSTVTFQNKSTGDAVTTQGCTPNKIVWKTNPYPGRTPNCGNPGSDILDPLDPDLWTIGSNNLCFTYNSPGKDTVMLKTGGTCKTNLELDSVKKVVCINPLPTGSFVPSKDSGCGPVNVDITTTTNTPLCGNYTYKWAVTYSATSGCVPAGINYVYLGGTSAASREPSFRFINPGIYTLNLTLIAPGGTCSTAVAPKTIKVKGKPNVAFNTATIPAAICQNQCITPRATFNCYIDANTKYQWNFQGASPGTSSLAIPGTICYAATGTYTISLEVTNECGDTTITRSIIVNPVPDFTPPNDTTVCGGSQLTYDLRKPGISFTWQVTPSSAAANSPSGTTGLISFTATNASNPPLMAIVTITATQNGCSIQKQFKVTVKPRPAKPALCSPPQLTYCFKEVASPLCATPSVSNTLNWCTVPLPGICITTPPVPRTDTAYSRCYSVTQINDTSGCVSDTATLCVTVQDSIRNNRIKSDTTLCTVPSTPLALGQSSGVVSGGNGTAYTYRWDSTTTGSWNPVVPAATGASYQPGALSVTTKYRRIVTSGICKDTSNVVTITIGSLPSPPIAGPQNTCTGATPALLTGPSGSSYTHSWERSSSAAGPWTSIANANAPDYQPPALTATTFYRRKDSGGGCFAYSLPVKITVFNKPVAGTIQPDTTVCSGGSVTMRSTTADSILQWEQRLLPGGNWQKTPPTFTNIQQAFEVRLIVVTRAYGQGCDLSDTSNVATISVSPKSVGGNTAKDAVVCSGGNGDTVVLSSYTGQILRWESSANAGAKWDTIVNTTPKLIYSNLTITTWFRAVVKSGACAEAFSDTTVITVVPSVTPANAGPPQLHCNVDSVVLTGNQPAIGTGRWSQVSGPNTAFISNPFSPVIAAKNLVAGVYIFAWTITGGSSLCASSVSTVRIRIWPLTTQANAGPDTVTVCDFPFTAGVQLNGSTGRPFETMRWSFISGPPGAFFADSTKPSTRFDFSSTGFYKLKWRISNDSTNGCPATEDFITLAVFRKPVAGTIRPDTTVCAGDSVTASLTSPAGTVEKWQWRFADSAAWHDTLPAASSFTFRNVQRSFYVRTVVKTPGAAPLCNLADTSQTVLITVNAAPPAAIKVLPDSIQEQPHTTFTFLVSSADSSRYRYLWNMGDRSGQTRSGRDITYNFNDTGFFTVRLTVTNIATECKGFASIRLKIIPVPGYLWVPDAICPRCPDARLHAFLPLGKGLDYYHLRIYSKWGKLLFETTKRNADGSPAEAWKADFPADTPIQQDTFMWVIEATYINGAGWKGMVYPDKPGRYFKSGFITVIK